MGLYLVKKLVDDLGGRLALSLETPGRFQVAVSFPLVWTGVRLGLLGYSGR